MVASIEAPFALLEKPVEIVGFDPIKSAEMSFGLIPKVFNSVDVILPVREEPGVVDSHMVKSGDVESIVSLEGVGVNNAVGGDLFFDDRQQGFCPGVGYDGGKNLSSPLEQAEYGHLARRASASLSFANSTEIAFIRFDFTAQFVAGKLRCDEPSQSHVETNGRVRLHPNDLGRSPCRLTRHEVLQESVLLLG